MKLMDIPDKSKLELCFQYKSKNYSMEVELQMKIADTILIQAVSCNGEPINRMELNEPVLVCKTESGLYIFREASFKLVLFRGTNMYAVSSRKDGDKLNRRQAYRVYINEPVKIKITKSNRNTVEFSGILKDISLTGMGIILPYKGDDILTMEIVLELSRNSNIVLSGEVVRIRELPNNKGYLYGCRFHIQKEALSRYIMSRQVRNKSNNKKIRQDNQFLY